MQILRILTGLAGLASALPAAQTQERKKEVKSEGTNSKKADSKEAASMEVRSKDIASLARAERSTITSAPVISTAAPTAPSDGNACSSIHAYTNAHSSSSNYQTIPASMAYDCLNSIPFDPAKAMALMNAINPFLEWQTSMQWVHRPPAEYSQKVQEGYYFGQAWEGVKHNISANTFKSEYDFELNLVQIFQQVHDGHFVYAPILMQYMLFGRRMPLVSFSADGTSLPEVYLFNDLNAIASGSSTSLPSAIKQIDGVDVEDYLNDWADKGALTDKDALWNNLFVSPPQLALQDSGTGSGLFNGGGRGVLIYPGASTTLTYANGSTLTLDNIALVSSAHDFSNVSTGQDFYSQLIEPQWTGAMYISSLASDTAPITAEGSTLAPLTDVTFGSSVPTMSPVRVTAPDILPPTNIGGAGAQFSTLSTPFTAPTASLTSPVEDGDLFIPSTVPTASPESSEGSGDDESKPSSEATKAPLLPNTSQRFQNVTFVGAKRRRNPARQTNSSFSAVAAASTTQRDAPTSSTNTFNFYPTPDVANPLSSENSGYFLDGNGYDDVAVLALASFIAENSDDIDQYAAAFAETNEKLISKAVSSGKKKLIIDLSANGGGVTLQAYKLFELLFPGSSPYSLSRWRAHEALDLMGQQTSQLLKKSPGEWTHRVSDNSNVQNAEGSVWDYTTGLNQDNKPFESWQAKFGPFDGGAPEPDNYTALMTFNLTDPLATVLNANVSLNKQAVTGNPQRPFEPENIIMVYDGYCASTCAIFSQLVRKHANVTTVVFGGRPNRDPMQAVGGTRGAQSYNYDDILDNGVGSLLRQSPALVSTWAGTILEDYSTLPLLNFTAVASLNVAELFESADDGSKQIPLQFQYQPADCRLYYTLPMIFDQSVVWKTAADTVWNGKGGCIAGTLQTAAANSSSAVTPGKRGLGISPALRRSVDVQALEHSVKIRTGPVRPRPQGCIIP